MIAMQATDATPAPQPGAGQPLLDVRGLTKTFHGLIAVKDVSFEVPTGSIVALIGPNGAGKTTTFNLIAGVMKPNAGQVLLEGCDVTGMRPDRICHAAIGRTFQLVKPFGALSVLENVMVGALRCDPRVGAAEVKARDILQLLELDDKARIAAHSLTLPDRKRLEVARALATGPKLLLLDEVMAGLRPTETDRMVAILKQLNKETGLTILLIEHVMRAVMALSQRVVVLNYGEKICDDIPEVVTRNPLVLDCYLGEEDSE